MAYSAALGEADRRHYDTSKGVLAHPLFPVCYEWPVSLPIRQIPALRELFPRLVHAEHDLVLHRLPREGDRLATRASIVGVHQRKPGAFVVFRFDTTDAGGKPVSTTDFGALYRGVAVQGPDRGAAIDLPKPDADLRSAGNIDVSANLAHVYAECARIFNPIHTDVAHQGGGTARHHPSRHRDARFIRFAVEDRARARRAHPLPFQRHGADAVAARDVEQRHGFRDARPGRRSGDQPRTHRP